MKNKEQNFRIKKFQKNDKSQVIVLAGVIMFISIIFISSLAPEIANIEVGISSEKSSSSLNDFFSIKKTIPYAVTFDLAENITVENNRFVYYGNISNLSFEFEKINNEIRKMQFKRNLEFNSNLNSFSVANPGSRKYNYNLNVTLTLRDKNEKYAEDVLYSIICKPKKI